MVAALQVCSALGGAFPAPTATATGKPSKSSTGFGDGLAVTMRQGVDSSAKHAVHKMTARSDQALPSQRILSLGTGCPQTCPLWRWTTPLLVIPTGRGERLPGWGRSTLSEGSDAGDRSPSHRLIWYEPRRPTPARLPCLRSGRSPLVQAPEVLPRRGQTVAGSDLTRHDLTERRLVRRACANCSASGSDQALSRDGVFHAGAAQVEIRCPEELLARLEVLRRRERRTG